MNDRDMYSFDKSIKPRIIKRKKPIKYIVIIIILLLLVLGVCFFLYYDLFILNDKEKCEIKTEITVKDKEQLNIKSIFVQTLYDKVKLSKEEDNKFRKFNDISKLYLAYRQIPYNDFYKEECSKFSEVSLKEENDLYQCISEGKNAFTEDALTKKYKELFGINTNPKKENIKTYNQVFKYIKSSDIYVIGNYLGGSDDKAMASKKVIEAYKENEKVIILEEVTYTNKDTLEKIENNENYKSGTYKYVFELEKSTNNYIYIKKEKIK